jgi:hypothetical protein
MTTHELPYQGAAAHAPAHAESFADSFNLFALIVMSTFVIAVTLALIGLSTPSWLGFA